MDIYTDGSFDIDKARTELEKTAPIQSDETAARRYRELSIATQLDIAESLRILAEESRYAMQGERAYVDVVEDPELAPERLDFDKVAEYVKAGGHVENFFQRGDLVHVIDDSEVGEVTSLGFDQGEMWADVDFGDHGQRYFVRNLERLRGDEAVSAPGPSEDAQGPATAERIAEVNDLVAQAGADGIPVTLPELEDVVDDIDEDFDGDSHTAAASALDTLKENEKARKAAKKKAPSK